MGEGLDDGTGGCYYRSPSEARAEGTPLRWGKQGAGAACVNNRKNRAGKIFLWGGLVFCGGNCFLCGKKLFEYGTAQLTGADFGSAA